MLLASKTIDFIHKEVYYKGINYYYTKKWGFRMRLKKCVALCFMLVVVSAVISCGGGDTSSSSVSSDKLVIYSPHPLVFINPLLNEFEEKTGLKVAVITDATGVLLDRVEAESSEPSSDIFWGGSLSTMAAKKDLFENYVSVNEGQVQAAMRNVEGSLTRFSDIPSIIMINTDSIGDITIDGYADLLNPALKGKIAYADPSKSSSSYEHLINMLYAMGGGNPDAGWDYVSKLCENLDNTLLNNSFSVYKSVADGDYAVGLTFEEAAANYVVNNTSVDIVYMSEGVISKADIVSIIKNAKNMENAKKFIDFVTSKEAQTTIVEKLNRRSVRTDVPVQRYLRQKEDINIIFDDEALSASQKEEWLSKFEYIFSNR